MGACETLWGRVSVDVGETLWVCVMLWRRIVRCGGV